MSVKVSAKASAKAAVGVSVAAGTAVLVTAIGAGWVLSTVGVAIAFIPNQIGARVFLPTRIGWSRTCQQSNQWAIETLAMTQDTAEEDPASRTRAAAQAWLRGHGYQPSVLPIGPLARLGARSSRANIAFETIGPRSASRTTSKLSPSIRCSRG